MASNLTLDHFGTVYIGVLGLLYDCTGPVTTKQTFHHHVLQTVWDVCFSPNISAIQTKFLQRSCGLSTLET